MFSVRALVFALVLVMAFVLVYPTLNSYIRQQAQLADLNAQVEAAKTRNDDLQADVDRWADPAYVVAQARERLSFVLPGETPYRVVDPETVPDAPVAADGPSSVIDSTSTKPWYTSVWESVAVAGKLPVDATTTVPTTDPSSDPASDPAKKPAAGTTKDATPPAGG
ncbi:septum formation initiator family protein [Cellulomonas sp. PhB150]|uniref:FtsB family cell division protein n=1 Tax=Cellulomonas sp. PhB150 TaxID=2485188 RepID=UPI000F4769AF|nr:septum formation initiator family protein [Cellulomonas sp. PhB150]ROS22992.1 cell division protein FtsB [Cellulomonas sp. PhB150]